MNSTIIMALCWMSLALRAQTVQEIELQEIFLPKKGQTVQELDKLNELCRNLDLALEFVYQADDTEPRVYTEYNGQKIPVSKNILEEIYNEFLESNPYTNKKASVRSLVGNDLLCKDEEQALAKRMLYCLKAMQKLLDTDIEVKDLPTVALCCSGGGYRALLSSAGLIKGLHDAGILDVIEYVVALSGSTWTLCPWAHAKGNFTEFYKEHIRHVSNGFLHLTPEEMLQELKSSFSLIAHYCLRKLIFKEDLSIVDFYGYCVGLDLLGDEALNNYLALDLPAQTKNYAKGERPLPVYTAVIPYEDGKNYYWLELTPWEVGSQDLGYAVPAWSYGRKFKDGVSTSMRPPMTSGLLMGICGSAMTASFEELCRLFNNELQKMPFCSSIELLAQKTFIGDTRVFPAQMRNITYHIADAPQTDQKTHPVIDAGIHINIPLKPLLHKNRSTDIIIICDASGDVLGAPELSLAEDYAIEHGFPFPKIDYTNISKKSFSVFDDGPDSQAPIIVYIPLVKNEQYSHFDPQEFLGSGKFLNTLNFGYSEKEALTVAGLFEFAAHDARETILELLQEVIKRKFNK